MFLHCFRIAKPLTMGCTRVRRRSFNERNGDVGKQDGERYAIRVSAETAISHTSRPPAHRRSVDRDWWSRRLMDRSEQQRAQHGGTREQMHLRARQGFREKSQPSVEQTASVTREAHRNMPATSLQQKQAAQQICQLTPLPACTASTPL